LEAVLAVLRREEPVAVAARRFGISENSLYRLGDRFLEGGKAALADGVGHGLWFRACDVRTDVEKGELELVYYAVIQQATGEEWPGVELTLSAKPELAPWLLGGVALPLSPPVAREQQEGRAAQFDADANAMPDIRGQFGYRFSGSPSKQMLKLQDAHRNLIANDWQVVRLFRSVAARGTSVAFPAPTRETVLTDGQPTG
jgi:hypothetical protein